MAILLAVAKDTVKGAGTLNELELLPLSCHEMGTFVGFGNKVRELLATKANWAIVLPGPKVREDGIVVTKDGAQIERTRESFGGCSRVTANWSLGISYTKLVGGVTSM